MLTQRPLRGLQNRKTPGDVPSAGRSLAKLGPVVNNFPVPTGSVLFVANGSTQSAWCAAIDQENCLLDDSNGADVNQRDTARCIRILRCQRSSMSR